MTRLRSRLENWFLRFSRDVLFGRQAHKCADRFRQIEGELRLLSFEQAQLRKRFNKLESEMTDDGK